MVNQLDLKPACCGHQDATMYSSTQLISTCVKALPITDNSMMPLKFLQLLLLHLPFHIGIIIPFSQSSSIWPWSHTWFIFLSAALLGGLHHI